MIHTTDTPEFASVKRRGPLLPKTDRRHSWTSEEQEVVTADTQSRVSMEWANVLWGKTFQTFTERILPTGSVSEALDKMAQCTTTDTPSGTSSRKISRSNLSTLKLTEAHMTNESADLICACVRHNSLSSERQNVLLLRRDETYDLVLVFDREVDPAADHVEIILELEDQLLNIPGLNVFTIPVSLSAPTGQSAHKHWWASFANFREQTMVRFHVSNSAKIGKWRMKVATQIKSEDPKKKTPSNVCLAFQRLHIAMNPDQIGRKKAAGQVRRSPWKEA